MRLVIATLVAATLSACTTIGGEHTCTGTSQVETRLYLGLSQPEVYTLLEGQGFWRENNSGRTISEPSRVLVHLHDASQRIRGQSEITRVLRTGLSDATS